AAPGRAPSRREPGRLGRSPGRHRRRVGERRRGRRRRGRGPPARPGRGPGRRAPDLLRRRARRARPARAPRRAPRRLPLGATGHLPCAGAPNASPPMELTLLDVALAALATLVGAAVQGAIGFGMNLVTVPVLALLVPEALP